MTRAQREWWHPYKRAMQISLTVYPKFIVHFTLLTVSIIAIDAAALAVPYLLRLTINLLSDRDSAISSMAFLTAGSYAILWTVMQLVTYFRMVFTADVLIRCDNAFMQAVFRRILSIAHHQQAKLAGGDIHADLDEAESALSSINTAIFWDILPALVQLAIVFVILANLIDFTFAAAFAGAILILFYFSYKIARLTKAGYSDIVIKTQSIFRFISERLNGLYDAKINQTTERELRRLDFLLADYRRVGLRASRKRCFLLGMQSVAVGFVLLIFTCYSVAQTLEGAHTVGDFVMISGYVIQLTTPFMDLAGSLSGLEKNFVALNRGLQYVDIPTEVSGGAHEPVDEALPVFKLLSATIGYEEMPVISNADLEIEEGRIYAIAGASGIGKTTLMNTLLGLQPALSGRALFRGVDVDAAGPSVILKEVAVVPQQPALISGSVRENLGYGVDFATDEEMLDLIQCLGLHDLGGRAGLEVLDYQVGNQGRELSGGQRQRIAIGRALLRHPRAMILDEPTSALDAEAESGVIALIRRRVGTAIIISHRRAVLEAADEVILVDTQGRLHHHADRSEIESAVSQEV